MTSGPDEAVREPAPVARHASHVDARFAASRETCRQAVIQVPELHYLGHYTEGAYDFSYDRLDGISGQPDRTDHERMGVQITNAVRGLDRMLQEVRTGALIRVVVHGQQGLVVCNSAQPNEHAVGFSRAPSVLPVEGIVLPRLSGAERVDEILSRLVTELREQVSLGSQNPGSWISAKPGDVVLPPVGTPSVSKRCIEGTADERVSRLFLDRVDPVDLQFVAYCRSGQAEFSVDEFDDPQLGSYFQEISVTERRLFYRNVCRQFPMIVRKFGRISVAATGGKIERLVLDVEQGALCYYRIRPGEYLVGITIDQRRVASTDDKIGEIALRCRGNLGRDDLVPPSGG
ncbi:MAG: hypothetical protein ACRDRX_23340 [Pseudonocardiaceae bacterium]